MTSIYWRRKVGTHVVQQPKVGLLNAAVRCKTALKRFIKKAGVFVRLALFMPYVGVFIPALLLVVISVVVRTAYQASLQLMVVFCIVCNRWQKVLQNESCCPSADNKIPRAEILKRSFSFTFHVCFSSEGFPTMSDQVLQLAPL